MALIVQKYGGSSVATPERITAVARRVLDTQRKGNSVVVVLSAMGGETDELISLAKAITHRPDPREMDVLMAVGEQKTVALFSMAVKELGGKARSYLAHQVRILTDPDHGRARIEEIDAEKVCCDLRQDTIAVIAGFQGQDSTGDITTLGRGGSDTTAVAVASAIEADICEIYTDVAGVFTADPNICTNARKLGKISYDEMLEMASLGAKVLHIRSVEFAKKYNIPLHVRSSFTEEEGTMVVREDKAMEEVVVSGVTYSTKDARITITRLPDVPGVAALAFGVLADAGIVVDMIIQGSSAGQEETDISFTVPEEDFEKTLEVLDGKLGDLGGAEVIGAKDIAKVSIVGVGMRTHAGVAARMFRALADHGINIIMISTSEIKVSCVIDQKYKELAVRVLHDAFELDKEFPAGKPKIREE
jgi:aspartate kinase